MKYMGVPTRSPSKESRGFKPTILPGLLMVLGDLGEKHLEWGAKRWIAFLADCTQSEYG